MISSPTLSIFDKKTNNFVLNSKKKIYCRNCGKIGHLHKFCSEPVTSLGIILYRTKNDNNEYLLVRRKDSIGYVEFIRGKYALNDIKYISLIIDEMSIEEKSRILKYDFRHLWKTLWMENNNNILFKTDYYNAKNKYDKIKNGIIIDKEFYNLKYFIEKSSTQWPETEWGFPKGRRNLKESNLEAALREFEEETNIRENEIKIHYNIPCIVEEYIGSNNVTYRHIYYIAKYIGKKIIKLDYNNRSQVTEISKIEFNIIDDCLKKFRDYHVKKKEVIINIHKKLNNQIGFS